jgi:hypothetical protein
VTVRFNTATARVMVFIFVGELTKLTIKDPASSGRQLGSGSIFRATAPLRHWLSRWSDPHA